MVYCVNTHVYIYKDNHISWYTVNKIVSQDHFPMCSQYKPAKQIENLDKGDVSVER